MANSVSLLCLSVRKLKNIIVMVVSFKVPKDADGMANNVETDQSDLGLHCSSENIGSLRYISFFLFIVTKVLPATEECS